MEKFAELFSSLEIRKNVLATSLVLEMLISEFAAELLDIKDVKNSRLFGNRSCSLSFNQKIDLLFDMGVVTTESRTKFQTFMEIRNQFMHNLMALNNEKCISFLEGKEKYLLRTYPTDLSQSKEKQLDHAISELSRDLIKTTNGIIGLIIKKYRQKAVNETTIEANKAFVHAVNQFREFLCNYFEDNKDLSNVLVDKLISLYKENFDQLLKERSLQKGEGQ